MNYSQTLDFLYLKLPMYSRIGTAAFKNDLTNTIALCNAMNNPQHQFKSIHVAGTNGKGSVSHMLAGVLQTAGFKTGLYTSPHLKDFRERIKVNGKICDENFVVDFTEKIRPFIETIEPSFFEITVAMAFEYFAIQKVDAAVIEVGLGGRFDSTNIITPELSVITNIGWDHMNMLGDSLERIAFEKAGIIKQNIPVVIGEVLPETKPVFERIAAEKNAPLSIASQKRYVADWKYEHHQLNITVADSQTDEREDYQLDLTGIYQTKNILTTLEAIHQLQNKAWKIPQEAIIRGLAHTKRITSLHGRWEVIHQNPVVVLDVAHNVDGMKQVAEQIELVSFNQLHIITGMVKDKEIANILSMLPKYAIYYFTKAQIPRALPEEEMAAIAYSLGLQGKTFADVNSALSEAMQHAHKEDMILICGSIFLVGEINF